MYLFAVDIAVWKTGFSNKIQAVLPSKCKLGCKSSCADGIKFCISFDLLPEDPLTEKSSMTLHNKVSAKWIKIIELIDLKA